MLEYQKKQKEIQENRENLDSEKQDDEDICFINSPYNQSFVLPNTEYTTVCNADFAPLICNEFISVFLQN
jgi:hypothetical protein